MQHDTTQHRNNKTHLDTADLSSERAFGDTKLIRQAAKNKAVTPQTLYDSKNVMTERRRQEESCSPKCIAAENVLKSCSTSCIADDTKKRFCTNVTSKRLSIATHVATLIVGVVMGILMGASGLLSRIKLLK